MACCPKSIIEDVLNEGAIKAHKMAFKKVKKVERKIGIDIHKRK